MRRDTALTIVCLSLTLGATACNQAPPPTITPAAEATPGTSVEIPVNPVPGQNGPVPTLDPATIPDLQMGSLVYYAEPNGAFSLQVPPGWPAQPQDVGGQPGSDVKLGVLFPSPEANGLITVTQFDNGKPPTNIGNLSSQVLRLTGVMSQPGYQELGRSNVLEREGSALRVELEYQRSDGVPMHALVLFQADNTTFSMVNVSVDSDSWQTNEGPVHDILGSYRVPAAAPSTTG